MAVFGTLSPGEEALTAEELARLQPGNALSKGWSMLGGLAMLPKRVIDAAAVAPPAGLRREDFTDIPANTAPDPNSPLGGVGVSFGRIGWQPGDELIGQSLETAANVMGGTSLSAPARAGEVAVGAGPVGRMRMIDQADLLKEQANLRRAKGWATGKPAAGWEFKRPEAEKGSFAEAILKSRAGWAGDRDRALLEYHRVAPANPLMKPEDWEFIDENIRRGNPALGAGATDKRATAATVALDMSPEARAARAAEQGFNGPWYHGSERSDRLTGSGKIDPKRATSGPMPFFTDNPEIASNYAKAKADTSLAATDSGNIQDYFTISPKDVGWSRSKTPLSVERSWTFLPPEIKADILAKAKRVGYENPSQATGPFTLHPEGTSASLSDDHFDYLMKTSARGNPLTALREMWHDGGDLVGNESGLSEIWKLAGFPHQISEASAPWTTANGVMPAMLKMKNPLNTENREAMVGDILPKLENMFKGYRSRKKEYGADPWDKNVRYSPREWIEQAKADYAKGDNSHVFTSIPDKITDALKSLGYDGILDTGGKLGGQGHTVAVPFRPDQVRATTAKFDPKNEGKNMLLGAGATDRKAAAATAGLDIFEHAPEAKPTPQMLIDAGQGAQDAYAALHGQAPEPAAVAPALPAATGPDVSGGAGGGVPGLLEAQAAAARRAGTRKTLEGLPSKAMKIGDEYFVPGPISKIHDVAEEYVKGIGRPYEPPLKYHPIDEEHSKAIARAFDEMPHTPNDPATKASYDALIKETLAQYQAIKKTGLKIEPILPDMADPYAANPRLAAKDVADNNHLWYFPTDQGFGSGGALEGPHPMMRETGETIGDRPLVANDLFRIVHDYFGHLKHGHGFRAGGEDNAWRTHSAMYSDLARPAMTTETRGQNSWVNYGPHGEKNRKASAADTVYADQKVGLMPEWTMRDRGSPEPIIAYHGTPHSFEKFDPAHIGTGEGNQAYGQGLYFAGHEPVSEWYRHQLSARRDPLLPKYGLDAEDGANVGMQIAAHGGDVEAYKAKLQQHLDILRSRQDTSKAHKNEIARTEGKIGFLNDAERNPGHLYEVAIDHPPEKFLDWDSPLSKQSESVMDSIKNIFDERAIRDLEGIDKPNDFISALGRVMRPNWFDKPPANPSPQSLAAAELRRSGIRGIKYLDQASRGGGKGTHNYVTFDAPRILRKYALPGAIGAGSFGALGRSRDDL